MSGDQGPALTDRRGMGGVIALDGFDYQLWEAMARVPAWLVHPSFESLILEGLEDIEARFFAPQAPHGRLLERFQAKSAELDRTEVQRVFGAFREFDLMQPQSVRVHALITPRLPGPLQWVVEHLERLRRARPFYAPFAAAVEVSDAKVRERLVEAFGEDLGDFVFRNVAVEVKPATGQGPARAAFVDALNTAFPRLEVQSQRLRDAFDALATRLRGSTGAPVMRADLIALLEEQLGKPLGLGGAFPLLLRSDRGETQAGVLEFDASAFSGGVVPFPAPDAWARQLVEPLERTAAWLRSGHRSRVALSGSYRLSTAFALGWAFRSTKGFELDVAIRDGVWASDDRAPPGATAPLWHVQRPDTLDRGTLTVSVGVLRDPSVDLVMSGAHPTGTLLVAHLPEALPSAQAAQASVSVIKREVSSAAARLGPERIALYFAGPASFAVMLGHRWNALPPTQLHEFLAAERRYVQTAVLDESRSRPR